MKYFKLFSLKFIKKYSTCIYARTVAEAESSVINDINNNVYKFKKHPGVLPKKILIPESFIKSVINVLADYPVKNLIEPSEKLERHLKCRMAPMEKHVLNKKVKDIQEKVLSSFNNVVINSSEEELKLKQTIDNKIQKNIYSKLYNWKPVQYDLHNSLLYLISRSAAEYSVLAKIFTEIQNRDPDFKPKSLFDFGSGVGTVTWAANLFWKQTIIEYFNVDVSSNMNDLAQILLQGGRGNKSPPIKGVFYRQFLPATPVPYDLVVCAYSMFELPSLKSRLDTIMNLWNRTSKYLVVVEQGTNAGFGIIHEIRDFLLQLKQDNKCMLFSPCPHEHACPRFNLFDGTPCNFEVSYHSLPLNRNVKSRTELYCYAVFKKCKVDEDVVVERWPRIVRSTLVRHKHSICRICTNSGKLEEVIFTASKYGKTMYHCARSTKWGDRLPIKIKQEQCTTVQE